MASTFTINKHIELPGHNDFVDTWDTPVNADFSLIDTALGSSVSKNATGLSGNVALAVADYQPLTIFITGTPVAAITYVVPSAVGGFWVFVNNTSGGQTVGIKSNAGGATINVAAGANALVSCDGGASGMRLGTNIAPTAAGSTTQVQYNSGGVLAGSASLTFDGTTLTAAGLSITGTTTLGDALGDTIVINAATASIPNGLNIGLNNLFLNGTQVGIGTATLAGGNLLTVAGNIKITTGGLIFSDATQLTSASSLGAAGTPGNVQYNNGLTGFAADGVHFTYDPGTHTLSVDNLTLSGTLAPQTGTGNFVRAVSPTLIGTTTMAAIGGAVVATQANQKTATSVATVVTPGRQQFHPSATKAYVSFDGSTGVIASSYNVSGVVRNGTGDYTITFIVPFSSTSYNVAGTQFGTGPGIIVYGISKATGSTRIGTSNTVTQANQDAVTVDVSFCGDQ